MQRYRIGICVFVAIAAGAQNLEKFSGTWRVNDASSHEKAVPVKNPPSGAPEIPPPPPVNHQYTLEQIQQSGRILKISGGEAGTTAVYTIDLSRNQVSDTIPDAPGVVRTASSHWDHGKIVTEWKMLRNGEEFMQGTDAHRLGSGEQLIVDRTIESPMHKAEVHLVFDRR